MSTATEQKTYKEHDTVICVGRYGQKCANFSSGGCKFSVPIWSTKEYIATVNKKTGELYWKLKGYCGPTGSGRNNNAAVDAFSEGLKAEGYEYLVVIHGEKCNQ